METTTGTVTSADGTTIAFDRTGTGPSLILVDAAGHYRGFSSFSGLIDLIAGDFTVYHYDRRSRGASGDGQPYQVAREIEDLAALIEHAGGAACLYGFSSGALLALHAAAGGLNIARMALLEPPIEHDDDRSAQRKFIADLRRLTSHGSPSAAVEYYLTEIGVPADVVAGMRGTESWSAMESVAHTLAYDSLISEATSFEMLAAVTTPTLVVDSAGSDDSLATMATAVAAAMPAATHRTLPGEWHGIPDATLAPALIEFLRAPAMTIVNRLKS
ncbi:MAG TPA: alpha/beta fold hydrolase [Aldersonia sp.]